MIILGSYRLEVAQCFDFILVYEIDDNYFSA